jgi:hypothetical protein
VDEHRLRVHAPDELRQPERDGGAGGALAEEDAPAGVVTEPVGVRKLLPVAERGVRLQPLQLAAHEIRIVLEDRDERAHGSRLFLG